MLDYYPQARKYHEETTPKKPVDGRTRIKFAFDQVPTPYKPSLCIQSTTVIVLATVHFLYTLFSCYCIKIQNYLLKLKIAIMKSL